MEPRMLKTTQIDFDYYLKLADVDRLLRDMCEEIRYNATAEVQEDGALNYMFSEADQAKLDALNFVAYCLRYRLIVSCETPEEIQEVASKIHDAYYRDKYYLCETSKDENGKPMIVYFRKYCPGLLAARLEEEGKTKEEIAEAVREEEGDPAFTTDAKYAKLFESMEEADSHMQHLNYRCKTHLEVQPAFLLNHKAAKRFLDSLFKEEGEK